MSTPDSKIDAPALRRLAQFVEAIGSALRDINRLDQIEREARNDLDRMKISRDVYYGRGSEWTDQEKSLSDAMLRAGRARALAIGQKARADKLAASIDTIHTYRAVLCEAAAAAAVDLARVAREAKERG